MADDGARMREEGIMVRMPEPTEQIRLAPVRVLRAVFSGVGQLLMAADRLREEDAEQARETRDEQQDPLATWDGRLSSSVRLIPLAGDEADSSPPARAKPDSSSPARAKPKPTSAKKAKQAEPADVKRAKATNASGSRKSGRSKTGAEPSKFRSLDLTGNVRMLSGAEIADMAADEFERSAASRPNPPTAETDPISGSADTATPPWSQAATPPWSQAAPSWSSWSANPDATAQDPPSTAPEAPAPEATAPDPPFAAVDLPITGYDDLSLPSLRARLRNLDADELAVLLAYERSHANREDVATMFERRIVRLAGPQDGARNRAGA
jgi:hypothetical protein